MDNQNQDPQVEVQEPVVAPEVVSEPVAENEAEGSFESEPEVVSTAEVADDRAAFNCPSCGGEGIANNVICPECLGTGKV